MPRMRLLPLMTRSFTCSGTGPYLDSTYRGAAVAFQTADPIYDHGHAADIFGTTRASVKEYTR